MLASYLMPNMDSGPPAMHIHLSLLRRSEDAPHKNTGRKVDKTSIGAPVLLSLPRRFEIYAGDGPAVSALNRSGSLGTTSSQSTAAATRSPLPIRNKESPYPLIRSYSLPTPASSPVSDDSDAEGAAAAPPAARSNSHSPLHLDIRRRPLSPIQEQSYVSPISLNPASPFADSEISTLELSGPHVKPPPFIQRAVSKPQRTPSETPPPSSTEPPSIPPLSFEPYFPGPHPSQDIVGPPRRPPKAYTAPVRSSIHSAAGSSSGSLHAESFITAKSVRFTPDSEEDYPEIEDLPDDVEACPAPTPASPDVSSTYNNIPCSPQLTPAPPTPALDRHGTFGSNLTSTTMGSSLRRKRQRFDFATPAFCMFWLGFLFPPCWWIGGWYFTFFTETPATRTMWEHYVRSTRWWAMLTCGLGVPSGDRGRDRATAADLSTVAPRRGNSKRLARPKTLLLPRWVRNPTQLPALEGIAYYYPFVSRPPGYITTTPTPRPFGFIHRYFDDVTRSRLEVVKVARETPRRIIDPWIGRCRRALCYWAVVMALVALAITGWSFAVGAGKARY
ncbi:hypothetical protein C8F01DRAFT_1372380 [Mycena amicta]|nr:hypothetical protein C8F01DRAFT_1372380 [Mycena amicta]